MPQVRSQEAYHLIRKHSGDSDFIILDIRSAQKYQAGHIEHAVHVNFHDRDFRERLGKLDREKTYLIYCHTAGRTGLALPMMKNMSFSSVYNMTGGIAGWKKQGLPLVTQ